MDNGAVELRIHGIRGGGATDLLDAGPEERVAGDELAGFFRPRNAEAAETLPGVPREVFTWGRLTSGQASRAFWLLLLPFMLANMAYWMRPRRLGNGASRGYLLVNRLYDIVVRALALSLTVLLTLAAAGIGMDLVGWQCTSYGAECAELRPWLGFLAAPASPIPEPGGGIVLGALLPLIVVVVLWRLSRRTGERYEAVVEDTRAPDRDPAENTDGRDDRTPIALRAAPLSHPRFWEGSQLVGRLRSTHIGIACCTVAGLLTIPALLADADTAAAGRALAGGALMGILAVTALLCVIAACWSDTSRAMASDRVAARLRLIGVASLPVAAGYALWPRADWTASGALPGFATALHGLLAVQCLMGAVLFALSFVLYRGSGTRAHVAMRGLAGPTTAALGVLLGGVFSAALGYQSAEWLGDCLYPGAEEAGCLVFQVPTAYTWLQLAFTLEAGIAVVAAAALWVVTRRRSARAAGIADEYGRAKDPWPSRDSSIAKARALGSMTELAPAALLWLLVPVAALVGVAGYAVFSGRSTPLRPEAEAVYTPQALSTGFGEWAEQSAALLVTAGSVLGALFLAALLWLGRSAYHDQPTREAVGMLWDVGTFWPRGAHPLAPPCYSERAIPQLVSRVAMLTSQGTAVVLSGHSQGSVLAAATVWQLPPRVRGRVALLTHGSPLYRLYARYFPAYFGPVALNELDGYAACWRNLWRKTDAIAGPVHLTGGMVPRAQPLPDPQHYGRLAGEAVAPEILGHSWYTRDEAYTETLAELMETVAEPSAHQGP